MRDCPLVLQIADPHEETSVWWLTPESDAGRRVKPLKLWPYQRISGTLGSSASFRIYNCFKVKRDTVAQATSLKKRPENHLHFIPKTEIWNSYANHCSLLSSLSVTHAHSRPLHNWKYSLGISKVFWVGLIINYKENFEHSLVCCILRIAIKN